MLNIQDSSNDKKSLIDFASWLGMKKTKSRLSSNLTFWPCRWAGGESTQWLTCEVGHYVRYDIDQEYGRDCIKDKLARANIYKLIAFCLIHTTKTGSEVQALKHCEKAIAKFRNQEWKKGEAMCLLLYIYILQQTKVIIDPYNSENENEEVDGDTDINYYLNITYNYSWLLKDIQHDIKQIDFEELRKFASDVYSEKTIDYSPFTVASKFTLTPIYKVDKRAQYTKKQKKVSTNSVSRFSKSHRYKKLMRRSMFQEGKPVWLTTFREFWKFIERCECEPVTYQRQIYSVWTLCHL